jgi:hypothetical protein
MREQDNLLTEEWEGAKSYDGEKARPSMIIQYSLGVKMEHCGKDHGYLLFLEGANHEPGGKASLYFCSIKTSEHYWWVSLMQAY